MLLRLGGRWYAERCWMSGWLRGQPVRPVDHGLERSSGLRALLDSKPADVAGRCLHRHQLQQRGFAHVRSCHWLPRAGAPGAGTISGTHELRHWLVRLELLQHLVAYPVEHHQGLLRRSGRLLRPSEHDVEGPDGQLSRASPARAQPTGVRTLDDQNVWVYRMRVHRDLVP